MNELEIFDNASKLEVFEMLDGLETKCLKEREETWHEIYGFVEAHLNWFEEIKKSKRW